MEAHARQPAIGEAPLPALPSLAYRGYALFVLIVIGGFATFDRQILGMLADPIRKEFGMNDTQLGLLVGLAFAVTYTTFCIPIGRLADRSSKRNVIVAAVSIWSVMTMLCGVAQNFVQLFLARVGVGFGEAGGTPPAQALISDMFPQRQRGTVMSIYLVGTTLGLGAGLSFGGWALQMYGWRTAFILAGLPGLILAPLAFFTLRDIRRGLADGVRHVVAQKPFWFTIRTLWAIRSLRYLILASAIQSLITAGLHGLVPTFLGRSYNLSPLAIGASLGTALTIGSIIGHLSGGPLADLLGRKDARAYLWLPMATSLIAASLGALAFYGPVDFVFVLLGLQTMCSGLAAAPMLAMATTLSPVWARATGAACLYFVINLVGLGVGPGAVGTLSQYLKPAFGEESMRVALLCALALAIPAALLYWLASRYFRADFATARAEVADAGAPLAAAH